MGLEMPARGLGSGTKEGFSGKEQDAETGFDYFGARYYMPALGRWAAVDPALDRMPDWSPYNYAYDNPILHTDPNGRQPEIPMTPEMADLWGHYFKGAGEAIWSTVKLPYMVLSGGLNDAPDFGPFTGVSQSIQKFKTGGPEEKMEVLGGASVVVGSFFLAKGAAPSDLDAAEMAPRLPSAAAGKVTGVLRSGEGDTPLVSGIPGPGSMVPRGTAGFDIVTRTHVEGHAAAAMRQAGVRDATLLISKKPCSACERLLPRMLPNGSRLRVVSPDLEQLFTSVNK